MIKIDGKSHYIKCNISINKNGLSRQKSLVLINQRKRKEESTRHVLVSIRQGVCKHRKVI